MTTTTLSVDVVCPDWCTETPEHHLAELDEIEGCIHNAEGWSVIDETCGPGRHPIEGDHHAKPFAVWLSTITRLDGREKATPVVHLGDNECSLEQALAVADAIRDLVEVYRLAGGQA